MRAVIRLAVCIVLAASSTAALAQGNDASSSGDDQQNVKDQETGAKTNATTPSGEKNDADVGAASGEPTRSDARAKADARTREEAAAHDYDQQVRQMEIWTSP
jgi:hypothetical protein